MKAVRPVIPAVLEQHLEDAAFCWLRRQGGLWSPLFAREHLGRVDRLLDAHLEGLRVAGTAAVAPALQNLQRWKTADEAFVSTYVLAHTHDPGALAALEQELEQTPDMTQGAAAALLWAGDDAAMPLMQRWWRSGRAALRRAAVPAAMRHPRVNRDTVILDAQQDADEALRARAWRAVGEWRLTAHTDRLRGALDDASPRCRFEAACALSLLGDATAAARIPTDLQHLQDSTRRRAILAWARGTDHASFASAFNRHASDERWHRDLIWALTFRGDLAGLAQLCHWLEFPAYARLAGYAIAHITGVDLEAAGLCREDEEEAPAHAHDDDADEPSDDVQSEPESHDEDEGLPEPDPERLSAWVRGSAAVSSLAGRSYVAGELLVSAQPDAPVARTLPQLWQIAYVRCQRGEAGALSALCAPVLGAGW
jgi:uncharacterized protein (TIGR02270 family)